METFKFTKTLIFFQGCVTYLTDADYFLNKLLNVTIGITK